MPQFHQPGCPRVKPLETPSDEPAIRLLPDGQPGLLVGINWNPTREEIGFEVRKKSSERIQEEITKELEKIKDNLKRGLNE